ncbi:MAG: ferritin-like domain-containing protein [Alicyclobacillus macrosporangiidus]|uniref:ferritin-like domain-containing protein n=1 Tax=Alicyclobacillus macrosporangiidus TaxID=392015 RepID=UPI0026EF570E|nr:ferritin-like domain-containing protein [Alicyclobacillus macrosporangiidus]MCL6598956.1 ferritin-like domain-containing protein [Alicyclobacillus macrosporangiidus]
MESLHWGSVAYHTCGKDFKDKNMFISHLQNAINNEASTIEFYEVLGGMAPPRYRDFVTHAREDEMVHLRMFRRLYRRLTGHEPSVQVRATKFSSYKEGLELAFRSELEAAELYRDMYLSTRVPKIRDILFRAMTDEMEHAQRFNFLYGVS